MTLQALFHHACPRCSGTLAVEEVTGRFKHPKCDLVCVECGFRVYLVPLPGSCDQARKVAETYYRYMLEDREAFEASEKRREQRNLNTAQRVRKHRQNKSKEEHDEVPRPELAAPETVSMETIERLKSKGVHPVIDWLPQIDRTKKRSGSKNKARKKPVKKKTTLEKWEFFS